MTCLHRSILGFSVVAASWLPAQELGDEVSEEEVTIDHDGIELAGTLVLPPGAGPHPGIVFLHGSGPMTREGATQYARRFAKLGFAGLAFDKRGSGESTGNWLTSSLDDLAGDAIAVFSYLGSRPEVDTGRIGYWGVSQAGWVATRAYSRQPKVGFIVIISGGGASPRESEMFSYETAIRGAGLSTADWRQAESLLESYFDYLETGDGRPQLELALTDAESKEWYRYTPLRRILPSDEEGRLYWRWVAAYDPAPDIEKIRCPVLLLFGDRDLAHPTDLAVRKWESALQAGGNEQVTIRRFPAAGHGIRLADAESPRGRPPFAEGYYDAMEEWLVRVIGRGDR